MSGLALCVAAAVLAVAPASSVASSSVEKCLRPPQKVLVADASAVLVRPSATSFHYRLCSRKTGRLTKLGNGAGLVGNAKLGVYVLRGSRLVYAIKGSAAGSTSWGVFVINATTGRLRRIDASPALPERNFDGRARGVTAVTITDQGTAAWIVSPLAATAPGFSVMVQQPQETFGRVIAAGTDVDPTSLTTNGTSIFWAQGSQPHIG